MAGSVIPALIDALVAAAQAALPDAKVSDGFLLSDEPGDYLMVGVEDPESLTNGDDAEAASVSQDQMAFGVTRPRMEEGAIHLAARSVNGDANQKAARDAVYAMHEALAGALRPTNDLGVTGVLKLSNGASLSLRQNQDGYGAVATLLYDIAFTAQI
jgi:hypothetical protein